MEGEGKGDCGCQEYVVHASDGRGGGEMEGW